MVDFNPNLTSPPSGPPFDPPSAPGSRDRPEEADRTEKDRETSGETGKPAKPEKPEGPAGPGKTVVENIDKKSVLTGPTKNPEIAQPEIAKDCVEVFDQIVQEAIDYSKKYPPETETPSQSGNLSTTRDLQTVKQFLKEAKAWIENQQTDLAQMLNFFKTNQGGALWEKIQNLLQKSVLVDAQSLKSDLKMAEQQTHDAQMKPEGSLKLAEIQMEIQPGKAILEILKAEINPKMQTEALSVAFQLLGRAGMEESQKKLIAYLKKKGLTDQELAYFMNYMIRTPVLTPKVGKPSAKALPLWLFFFPLLCFGILNWIGMPALPAVGAAILASIVAFFAARFWEE